MENIKKILLVVPPGMIHVQKDGTKQCKECFPPVGLAYLAAQIKGRGNYDVKVYDMVVEDFWQETVIADDTILYGATFEQYQKVLEEYNPDLVGIQCMLSSRSNSVLELARLTKDFNKKIIVALGGHHATALPEHVLREHTDFVVLGESDHSFPELVDTLNAGGDISRVMGIVYRGKTGELITQPRHDFVRNLDDLPFPAWDVLGLEKYWKGVLPMGVPLKKEKYGLVCTSRGCPHLCHYCSVPQHTGERNYRARDLDQVIGEIRWLVDRYGIEELQFTDDNFFVNLSRTKKLVRLLIKNFPGMAFAVPTGTDLTFLDFELIDLLKEAGFHHLAMGIETGDMDLQGKYVDKKIDLNDLKSKIAYIKKAQITTTGFFLLGFPGETLAQMKKTTNLATTLDLDYIHFIMLTPIPGSRLYDHCVQNDLLYEDFDVAQLRYSNTFIKNPNVPREVVEDLRKSVWKEYMSKRINIAEYDNRGWSQQSKPTLPEKVSAHDS